MPDHRQRRLLSDRRRTAADAGRPVLPGSDAARLRRDRERAALREDVYVDHIDRLPGVYHHPWRSSYRPCRRKSDIRNDYLDNGRGPEYRAGRAVYLRIRHGDRRSSLGDHHRSVRICRDDHLVSVPFQDDASEAFNVEAEAESSRRDRVSRCRGLL